MDFFRRSSPPKFVSLCLENQNTDESQIQTNIAMDIPSESAQTPHYSAQASYFAAFRGIRDTKIEKSRGIQDKTSL